MTAPLRQIPEHPPAALRYRRRMDFVLFARQAWRSRVLAFTLSERELRVRYKQALLGVAWAFLAPLSYVVVFTLVFDNAARIETFDRPYPVFSYAAIIPWAFFAQTISRGTTAIVDNLVLLNKVSCPRETFVFSAIGTSLVDMLISALAFPIVVLVFGESFYGASVYLLPILVLQVLTGATLALLFSALLMYVRDLRHLIPLGVQLLMFATPVVWGLRSMQVRTSDTLVSLYAFANPIATVCESYRRILVYGQQPDWALVGWSSLSVAVGLLGAYWVFKKLEPGFADVA